MKKKILIKKIKISIPVLVFPLKLNHLKLDKEEKKRTS